MVVLVSISVSGNDSNQLSVISYQLSVISYQLSVTSYQLPVTSYQLPVTSYQLPVISYQLPVTSYQLPVISYQLRVTSYQLPVTSYQLSINLGTCVGIISQPENCSVEEPDQPDGTLSKRKSLSYFCCSLIKALLLDNYGFYYP
ncbi:MAG: hypothetical protein GPI96_17540 [Microcystis aeruginosa BS13-02]|nr:hypothetical protein [Microcystis aeruginosa BS13-02]